MAKEMRKIITEILKGIERGDPNNLRTLEEYVKIQAKENICDLEANLSVLGIYNINPQCYNADITSLILLKALTNLPHIDFRLCKCLLSENIISEEPISHIMYLGDILEQCDFEDFWECVPPKSNSYDSIVGFQDSIRKFVCHVVGYTFQTMEKDHFSKLLGENDDNILGAWVEKYGWLKLNRAGVNLIFITNHDANTKNRKIIEKIDFEIIARFMAACL